MDPYIEEIRKDNPQLADSLEALQARIKGNLFWMRIREGAINFSILFLAFVLAFAAVNWGSLFL